MEIGGISINLQQPPLKPAQFTPDLVPVKDEREIEARKKEWTAFLFGSEQSPFEERDRPALNLIEYPDQYQRSPEIERLSLTYRVEPGTTVRAYLLRPRKPEGELPGVVLFHQTDRKTINVAGTLSPKQQDPPQEIMAADLARRGYVVLCPECFVYSGHKSGDKTINDSTLWRSATEQMQKRHPRWKGLGRMVWDGSRAVDVLTEYNVDPKRIGAIGHSLGAKQVLFVAAFDERIRASVFSDGGIWLETSNWNEKWYLGQDICQEEYSDLENHQLLAMIAPRAFLLIGGRDDNVRAWPFIEASIPLWESHRQRVDIEDIGEIGWFQHEKGHCWPPEAQEVGFAFLSKYLKEGQ